MRSSLPDPKVGVARRLRRVRRDIARLEANLPSGNYLRSYLTPEQQHAFDRLGPLFKREQHLMGIEWGARLLAPHSGRHGSAVATSLGAIARRTISLSPHRLSR